MAYSFKPGDDSALAGVRRIARDQIDTALEEADADDLRPAERIHQVRKRCKKLRGLIRLVRPGFDAYAEENAAFRDAARLLSDVRDAAALVETCDALSARFEAELEADAFAPIRDHFAARARDREAAEGVADRLEEARAALARARERVGGWTLCGEDGRIVAAGLAKTHRRAAKAMARAAEDPTGERLHAWRKRAKYHWYHLRLLKSLSPIVAAAVAPADRLSELLGDHHDIHVLMGALDSAGQEAGEIAEPQTLTALRGLARARQDVLEAQAFRQGAALFSEPAKGIGERTRGYWRSVFAPSAMVALK